MLARSASTHASDPYRAGLELGSALCDNHPEVIFLFSSVHYGHSNELLEGIYDSLERDDTVVVGNTGDGFYETGGVGDIGAAALGLNTQGRVRWHTAVAHGVHEHSAKTVHEALAKLQAELQGVQPAFMFLTSDFKVDPSILEKIIERETSVPLMGGLAADDNQMAFCALYNREVHYDAILLLAAVGDIDFRIVIGNALTTPIGKPGVIDRAEGSKIYTIDGTTAMDFLERETGRPLMQSDRGVTSLTIIDTDQPEIRRLRSLAPGFSSTDSSLGLYGGIERGKTVQVRLAQPDEILREVYEIAEQVNADDFDPAAAVIVSCAGRKWVLGERIDHEVKALAERFGHNLAIAGFPRSANSDRCGGRRATRATCFTT
ncbi:FIST N-terminal domain-containing protein [Alkalilimnicola ehrlichii]|uniref:FIST N-terminal domain-containing protein n=1 Tax=Alkalilimnicola ehrlichii TaxID=351052 RepID=UPI001C6EE905|nr:FIST N-terminal domain-containing protein [Alkalilimnicola ehrlichii]